MKLSYIRQQDVRIIAKILGYKMHYSARINLVSAGVINTPYKMVEKENFDVCEMLSIMPLVFAFCTMVFFLQWHFMIFMLMWIWDASIIWHYFDCQYHRC